MPKLNPEDTKVLSRPTKKEIKSIITKSHNAGEILQPIKCMHSKHENSGSSTHAEQISSAISMLEQHR